MTEKFKSFIHIYPSKANRHLVYLRLLIVMKRVFSRFVFYRLFYAMNYYVFARVFLGDKFYCPCCGGYFRKFLSFRSAFRPYSVCPRCGSFARHRLLYLYLKNKSDFFRVYPRLKVLDVAPTIFFQKLCFSLPNIDYTSVDLESPLAMFRMDITNLTFPDNTFDCIICYHVLQYVKDDSKAMKEFHRVLKKDGWAILQVPYLYGRTIEFKDAGILDPKSVRIYGSDYKDRLESVGFKVRRETYAEQLDDSIVRKCSLVRGEIIYFCTK